MLRQWQQPKLFQPYIGLWVGVWLGLIGCSQNGGVIMESSLAMSAVTPSRQTANAVTDIVFSWPTEAGLFELLGQQLAPQHLASQQLQVVLGPPADVAPWHAAVLSQQRQRTLEQQLRQLGYQGQIVSHYQPSLAVDVVQIGVGNVQR
ncbi:MAG: hypothetical protein R3Y10_09760 [Ferrimonas sp.]